MDADIVKKYLDCRSLAGMMNLDIKITRDKVLDKHKFFVFSTYYPGEILSESYNISDIYWYLKGADYKINRDLDIRVKQ